MRNPENRHQEHSNLCYSFELRLAKDASEESPSFVIIVLTKVTVVVIDYVGETVVDFIVEAIVGIDSRFLRSLDWRR